MFFLLHKFKMITFPDAFFIFLKIKGVGGGGVKGKKMAQNDKKLCLIMYHRNCTFVVVTVNDCGFSYMCVKYFYHFSKFWFSSFFFQSSLINAKRNSEEFFTCVRFFVKDHLRIVIKICETISNLMFCFHK